MVTSIPEFEDFLQDRDPGRQRVLDNSMLMEPIRRIDTTPPVTVEPKTSIAEAVRLMQERHIGCVLVTEEGRLVGIFTERDVLRELMGVSRNLKETAIDELMTERPETLSPNTAIAFALNKMSIGGFRHVPLVDDNGHPVGIVSVKDIVDYIVDFFPEVLNCPPEPDLNISRSREGA